MTPPSHFGLPLVPGLWHSFHFCLIHKVPYSQRVTSLNGISMVTYVNSFMVTLTAGSFLWSERIGSSVSYSLAEGKGPKYGC